MTRHIRKILFALIPLTFLLFQQSSSAALEGEACSPEPTNMLIGYGSLITCSIDPTGESDLFRFNGQTGESVIISAARESGNGTPCVTLFDQAGTPLGSNVGQGFQCSISGNQFFPFKLPSTGTYTIVISEFLNDQTVNYSLALERVAPPSPPAMPIFYGDLLTDEINPTADLDLFQFPGQAGESVIISAARESGNGTPCVSLFDQAGTSLGGNVGQGFQCSISGNQFFPFKLPSTGTYTIVISEFLNDQTVDYSLALERVAPPSPPATSISYGQFLTDEINPLADLDLFYFYGTAASTIRISVARGGGNGTPCVSLFDQAGTSLGGNVGQGFQCSISGNQFPSFNLPSTGTYTIVISEFLNDQTVGYSLELQCLTACPSPPSRADLSLIKTDCPDPAGADSTITYTITVANSGPDPATSVTVTDILPPLTAFVSCSSTGGVCGGSGNSRTVTFNSLAVGASETITLIAVVNATAPDGIVLSNTAEVSSALFDPNLNNNAATATTTVGMTQMPGSLQFSAPSYSVNEDGGNATITITRTGGSDGAVSVNYATANGTATAGSDYTAASGTLTFADGETSKTFTVPITSDSLDEPDETVNLTLSAPTGCATLGIQAAAVLTILDDDPTPTLSINDVTITEDNGGTVNAVFTVGLSAASGQTVAVNFATANARPRWVATTSRLQAR